MQHLSRLTVGALLALALTVSLLLLWGSPRAQSDDPVIRARQLLLDEPASAGFRPDLSDLRLLSVRQGLSAEHVRYQQTANGLPVFGAYVSVSLPKDGNAQPLLTSRHVAGLQPNTPVPVLTSAEALAIALDQIGAGSTELQWPASSELMYYPADKRGYVLAWQIVAPTLNPLGSWLVLVDAAGGEVLYKHDLIRYDNGRVFDPNPAKTNGGTAPAPNCDTTTNEGLLAGQYRTKDLVGIDTGQNKLKGAYADLTAPGIPDLGYKLAGQANEASRSYVYACNDDRFEEVMAYYHVDAAQRKLQSLGFTGQSAVYDSPAPIHAHWFPDCNAFYHPISRGLHFGDSAVFGCPSATDLAEDGDVVVHEYGHALQDEQIPGWAFGPYPLAEQAASMGEGFADFLTGAIFGDPCLGEYANFGNSACDGSPGLRWLQDPRDFPAGFEACPDVDFTGDGFPESEEPHCGGEVWGGALWDLVESLPGGVNQANRDLALTLVMDAQFYLDPVATFNEAAAAVCLADTALYGGAHRSVISTAFAGRGIMTGSCGASDFPYAYLRIRHTWLGDLVVRLKAGPDPTVPLCNHLLLNRVGGSSDDVAGYVDLTGTLPSPSPCAPFLPPSQGTPWWLEVQDFAAGDRGNIANFEVSLAGGTRCVASDVPVSIPDPPGGAVRSRVDCTNQSGPPGSTTPTPTPGPTGPGSITIVKDAIPNDPQDFQFSGDWEPGGVNFNLDDDSDGTLPNSRTFSGVSPGLHIVTEGPIPSGWFVSGIVCSDESNVDIDNATAIVNLQSAEHVTCTFTNEPTSTLGSITIVKDAIPNDPQDFQFSGDWVPGGVSFSLDDDGDVTLPNSQTFSEVRPGLRIVTEGPIPSGWFVSGIVCSDGSNVDVGNATAIVNLQSAEHVTCTFANQLTGTGPPTPSITGSNPPSPANDNNPEIIGSAVAGSSVSLFTNGGCSGTPVTTGSAATFASPGVTVSVLNDQPTTFYANATLAGNTSGCSAGFTYVEDSTPPAAPSITGSSPPSPANDNSPEIRGSAEAGSTVKLFTNAGCSGAPVATGSAAAFASPGITVSVPDNSSTSFFATAADAAGNASPCSGGFTYVESTSLGTYYHPLAPCRILDTRSSPQGVPAGKVGSNGEITVDVTGPCNVPNIGVSAVVINTTVTEPTAGSYLTVYPSDVSPRPTAANLNFLAGQTVGNLVTVKVGIADGSGGSVKVYNAVGQVHAIFDVVGWYGGPTGGSRFTALSPLRIVDTRMGGGGGLPGGREFEVCFIDGVLPTAVVINVTVTQPTANSYLTVYPSQATRPLASNLNFGPGQTVPNLVIVKLGSDGCFRVYNAAGTTHVVIDLVGLFGPIGDLFYPLSPCRTLDTRASPQGVPPGKVGSDSAITVDVTAVTGVPCQTPPSTASAVVVNTTVTEPTAGSYLTVYPSDPRPTASNLNFVAGQTVPNLVVAKVGTGGNVRAYNAVGQTHVIMDTAGYFAP